MAAMRTGDTTPSDFLLLGSEVVCPTSPHWTVAVTPDSSTLFWQSGAWTGHYAQVISVNILDL